MDLLPSDDQCRLTESFRRFLAANLPVTRLCGAGPDQDLRHWPGLAELGCFGIDVGEESGGAGLSAVEQALLCIEAGRHLVSPAFVATMLAATAAEAAGDHALLERVLGGELRVVLANAVSAGPGAGPVPDGHYHLIGSVEEGDHPAILVTPAGTALLPHELLHGAQSQPCIDETTGLAGIDLFDAQPTLFVPASVADLYPRALLLAAANATGMAQSVMEVAVAYAGERRQFDRPIGTFQAVSHSCADMAIRCETALSQLSQAAIALADNSADAAFDVRAGMLIACRAAIDNAERAIHLHGAMGFTRAMPLHHFLKRAWLWNTLFGGCHQLLDDLAALPTPP